MSQWLSILNEVGERSCLIIIASSAILVFAVRRVVLRRYKNKLDRKLKDKLTHLSSEMKISDQLDAEMLRYLDEL